MTTLTLLPPRLALGFLEGIGTMEMMLVGVIGLLLFGGKGLPEMARTFGRVIREFKKASAKNGCIFDLKSRYLVNFLFHE
ncbi:hypothetical protein EBZ70_12210, partial [bacterium]|nr:hypothetical protein [bacterium]